MVGRLVYHVKKFMPDGAVKEIVVWKVPRSPAKPYGIKYSFVYIVDGKRVIGYDNAEGKKDHRHFKGGEYPYQFHGIEKLWADFHEDIARYNEENR